MGERWRQEGENDDVEGDILREECGVVGVYRDEEESRLCYLALHALQHRGQEGAGILKGGLGIGHVRYATLGASEAKNIQWFVAGNRFGSAGVAHNGNLVNYRALRAALKENGSIFNSLSDTKVVMHLIASSTVSVASPNSTWPLRSMRT
eukprot:Gb_26851 [translate_table: standard]